MSDDLGLDWYVAAIEAAHEDRARLNAGQFGIAAWLPRYTKTARHRGKRVFVERLLLPGYLFVGFERDRERWQDLRQVPGVLAVVAIQGRPTRVPHDVVGSLMVGCLTGYFDLDQRRIGAKVQMLSGAYRDKLGRIVRAPETDRVTVMLSGVGEPRFEEVALRDIALAR